MRIFLAGIMQGSHRGLDLHNQDYRGRLKRSLAEHLPGCQVYDPLADHSDSLDYDEARGREVFFGHNAMCAEMDLLIAFVPEASMGTAIEMWEAYQAGRIVISISPLVHNWAVRFLSHSVYPDLDAFEAVLQSGELARSLAQTSEISPNRRPE